MKDLPLHLVALGCAVVALIGWAGTRSVGRRHRRDSPSARAGFTGAGKPKDRREYWSRRYRAGAAWAAGTVAIGPHGVGPMSFAASDAGDSGGGDGLDISDDGGTAGCGGGDGCGGGCGGSGCGGGCGGS